MISHSMIQTFFDSHIAMGWKLNQITQRDKTG